jgi:hypothetical protein
VGVFRGSNPGLTFTVTREGEQLYVQLAGQPKFPAFPESARDFFLKMVDAQITFDVDAQGKATQLTLHQNGADQRATRLDDAEAKRIAGEDAARAALVAQRYKDQKAAPGSEEALKSNIEGLRAGEPKYDLMSPGLAQVTRQQLPQLKETISKLGALQSISFKGVGPGGADIYEVKFEHGVTEWRIGMTPDGKIQGVNFRAQ